MAKVYRKCYGSDRKIEHYKINNIIHGISINYLQTNYDNYYIFNNYFNGKVNGVYLLFDRNGNIEEIKKHIDDYLVEEIYYHTSGYKTLRIIDDHNTGRIYTEYYKNGNIKETGDVRVDRYGGYLYGGFVKFYSEDGTLIEEKFVDMS
jgi:hypothetical protein